MDIVQIYLNKQRLEPKPDKHTFLKTTVDIMISFLICSKEGTGSVVEFMYLFIPFLSYLLQGNGVFNRETYFYPCFAKMRASFKTSKPDPTSNSVQWYGRFLIKSYEPKPRKSN